MTKLSPVPQKFILYWGEMGTRWGINRTVAQMKDVWEMFRMVLDERKKREIDPTIRLLRECIAEAEQGKKTDQYTEGQLRKLREFFETTTTWYTQVRTWPTTALVKFVKLGDKVLKGLGIGG